MKASANSDASMRPERSSRVTKPILSPFLFFITRMAMIMPAIVCVSREGFRSMMRWRAKRRISPSYSSIGWPVRYTPRVSFSPFRRSLSVSSRTLRWLA
ncbi:hypothetical protein D3C78_991400 [compost metagenome]